MRKKAVVLMLAYLCFVPISIAQEGSKSKWSHSSGVWRCDDGHGTVLTIKPAADGEFAVKLSTAPYDEEGMIEKRNGRYVFHPSQWTLFSINITTKDYVDGRSSLQSSRNVIGTAKTGKDLISEFAACGCLDGVPREMDPAIAALRRAEKPK
ncbi:MAG: hypothetical protein ACLQOO_29485 [Terriglobia bacterium]